MRDAAWPIEKYEIYTYVYVCMYVLYYEIASRAYICVGACMVMNVQRIYVVSMYIWMDDQ